MFVVGYDDSDGARRALDVAVELARLLGESLVVAFAAQPPGRGVGDEYRTHEHSARAIVVGTYGESPLRGAVLGSTPHKLLHLSRVPVLAVPAGRTSAG
jgi:nucleotide-binding universal stress UspA family protein